MELYYLSLPNRLFLSELNSSEAERDFLPLALRAFRTLIPPLVAILARKPNFLILLILLG